jgi:hypothetical protein
MLLNIGPYMVLNIGTLLILHVATCHYWQQHVAANKDEAKSFNICLDIAEERSANRATVHTE